VPPLKSIAVTPIKRGGGRKQPSPTLDDHPADSFALRAALARPPRRTIPQMTHRFRVGEKLHMIGGGHSVQRAASGCKVISLLPYEGRGALLYRVRGDTESFERIVSEADLTR
jgi:hypothetical protein